MTSRTQWVILVVAAVIGTWFVVRMIDRMYLSPRAELVEGIEAARGTLDAFARNTDDAIRVETELRAHADQTLGGTVEEVDHRARARLNRIVERIGLGEPAVGTGTVTTKRSPARRSLPRTARWRSLRDEPDCLEVEAWVVGRGTLEQVVRLVDELSAEPWVSRIDSVKLDPKDGGTQMAVSVRLTTFILPGRQPSAIPAAVYDDARLARFAALVDRNPFRLPVAAPPPPETEPESEPEPEAAPPYPYGDWVLTGVAVGPDGHEAWLRNTTSGETRRLTANGTLEQVKFADIARDAAVFEFDGNRFRVLVGHRLDDRVAFKE